MGDHVHLQLPFKNTGNEPISNATVEVLGEQQEGSSPGVYIYNGVDWGSQQTVQLTPTTTLDPGEEGVADFWIYVTNNDPTDRQALGGETWLQVRTGSGEWTIRLVLSPVQFDISGNGTLQLGSCLHHPDDFEIRAYAQYAAGISTMRTPSNSDGDPDTLEQAVRNLVARVREEYDYNNEAQAVQWAHPRVPDTILLRTQGCSVLATICNL